MMPPNPNEIARNMLIRQFGSEENALRAMKKQAGNNKFLNNAISLFEKGDYKGLQTLSENAFKENHMDPKSMIQNFVQRSFMNTK